MTHPTNTTHHLVGCREWVCALEPSQESSGKLINRDMQQVHSPGAGRSTAFKGRQEKTQAIIRARGRGIASFALLLT